MKKLVPKLSFLSVLVFVTCAYFVWWARHNVTICVPRGAIRVVTLPDSSEVTLNSESSLKYNSRGWSKKREVVLSGEAFFKIKLGNPFSVRTEVATVKTFGARFSLKLRGRKATVSCVSGKVTVVSNHNPSGAVELQPGFTTSVQQEGLPSAPYPSTQDVLSWTSGEMRFTNRPLREVLSEMARRFNINFRINKNLHNLTFTGRIKDSDVNYALNFVSLACGLKYSALNDSSFVIY